MTRDELFKMLDEAGLKIADAEELDLKELLGMAARAEEFDVDPAEAFEKATFARSIAESMYPLGHVSEGLKDPDAITALFNCIHALSNAFNNMMDVIVRDPRLSYGIKQTLEEINRDYYPYHMAMKTIGLRRLIDEVETKLDSGMFSDNKEVRAEFESALIEMENEFKKMTGIGSREFDFTCDENDEGAIGGLHIV